MRPNMPRRPLFLAFLLVAVAGIVLSDRFVARAVPPVIQENPRAFLNAAWGMSPAQVKEASHSILAPSASSDRFYRPAPGTENRTQTLEAHGQKFLGREAVVSYTFLDDRLFSYHVFTSDSDADRLDADMRRYLVRIFGTKYSPVEDDSSLKMVWQFKDKLVNYWFYEEDLALAAKFKAGFGVEYKGSLQ